MTTIARPAVTRIGEDWRTRAACTGRDPRMWDTGNEGNEMAKALCSWCTVQAECTTANPEPVGIVVTGVAYDDYGKPAGPKTKTLHVARPPRRLPDAEIVEGYLAFSTTGLTRKEIASRLQVTEDVLRGVLNRARAAGDARIPAPRRYAVRGVAA